MDEKLFKSCNLDEIDNPKTEDDFEYLPCQRKFRMRPEDEISLDSIFSAILSLIEPTEVQFRKCSWNIDAKDMLNEKQAILFEENLCISKLKNTNCKLSEENKVFLDHELQQIGEYCLNVEESYDGYVVFSHSQMIKGKNNSKCGHCLKGKYDDKFVLIAEKRVEFDYIDNAKVEKTLDARTKNDTLIAVRSTKINGEGQKFKAVVNIKGRDDVFILDGGIMLLTRYLVINHFQGEFQCYSMNLFGKITRCVVNVHPGRKKVRVFYKTFDNIICVSNTQYFNDVPQEVSETFITPDGKIALHFWHGYNYVLHSTHPPCRPVERILPKLELMWKADNILFKKYQLEKKLNYAYALEYLVEHADVSDFLHDYVLNVLKYKPNNVLEFTVKFFQNMKSTY